MRKIRITPNLTIYIKLGFSMLLQLVKMAKVRGVAYARQPNRSRLDMQVHQIVDNPTLQVVLNAIDDDLLADIHELQIRKITLGLINCLVNLLVIFDAITEVLSSYLGVQPYVVWRCSLDLQNIAHDQVFIVAL